VDGTGVWMTAGAVRSPHPKRIIDARIGNTIRIFVFMVPPSNGNSEKSNRLLLSQRTPNSVNNGLAEPYGRINK
jgi:hypothetical protein